MIAIALSTAVSPAPASTPVSERSGDSVYGDLTPVAEAPGDEGLTLYLQGSVRQLEGDHRGAIRFFLQALLADSTQGAVYLGLARSYGEVGRPDSAVVSARQAARWAPEDPDAHRIAAIALSRLGRVEEAVDAWQQALALDPDELSTRLNLLALLDHLRRREEALRVIESAPVAHRSVPTLRVRLGRLLLGLGRPAEGIDELAAVLGGNPDYPEAEALLLMGLAQSAAAAGSIPSVQRLLEEQPDLDRVRLAYSRLLLATDAWNEAEPHLERLEQARPDDGSVLRLRGIYLYRAHDFEGAEDRFRTAAELLPADPEPLRWLCRIAMMRGQPAEALKEAGRVQARAAGDLEGLLCQAFALSALERDTEALVVTDAIREVDPSSREGGMLRAQLLSRASRWDEAIRELERLRSHHPTDREIRFRLGAMLEEADQVDRAIGVLDSLLLEDPEDHQVLNHLGYLCIDRGLRLEESVRRVRRALELDPGNAAYLDSYGWGLYRLGDAAAALAPLEEASRKSPSEGEIFRHLGEVHLALGQLRAARDALLRARELMPEDVEVTRLLRELGP